MDKVATTSASQPEVVSAPAPKRNESRSPDGDGLPMEKGLQGSDTSVPPSRSLTAAEDLPLAIEPHVHARVGSEEHGRTSVKEAAGSEPADSHTTVTIHGAALAGLMDALGGDSGAIRIMLGNHEIGDLVASGQAYSLDGKYNFVDNCTIEKWLDWREHYWDKREADMRDARKD